MKKCPKCKTVFGHRGGQPGKYVFCPHCGTKLAPIQRHVYFTEEEWEEYNRFEHGVPWNTDIKVKGMEDESF